MGQVKELQGTKCRTVTSSVEKIGQDPLRCFLLTKLVEKSTQIRVSAANNTSGAG